jgi:hypothetical protein
MWATGKEDCSYALLAIKQAAAIIDRVPREVVTELKERVDALDQAYKCHGAKASFDIAHSLIRLGADRQMVEVLFDAITGFIVEDEEAKAQAHKQAADTLIGMSGRKDDDADEYLAVLEVIKEWYT